MAWQTIATAPKVTDPATLPPSQRIYAHMIAPTIKLRDVNGSVGLGLWSVESKVWRITKGVVGVPVEWDTASPSDLAAPPEVWNVPGYSEPEADWKGGA